MANNEYKPVTAQDAIADLGPLSTDVENAKKADDAGVYDAAYVDYEKALKNYESRSDIETLEQRLARENGGTFDAAKEVRQVSEPVVSDADAVVEAEKFKARQAKETAKVSEGREVATIENDNNED